MHTAPCQTSKALFQATLLTIRGEDFVLAHPDIAVPHHYSCSQERGNVLELLN